MTDTYSFRHSLAFHTTKKFESIIPHVALRMMQQHYLLIAA